MANINMTAKVLNVCKTTAQWAAEATVISKGILCVEFTENSTVLVKIGDGAKAYSDLPYVSDGAFQISNYYTKTETDTAISTAVSALGTVVRIKGVKATVAELPSTDNEAGDLWFVGTAGDTQDNFEEYVWTTSDAWEYLGKVQTKVDLSDYATTDYVTTQLAPITTKLATIEEGANKTVVDSELSDTSTNPVENRAVKAALTSVEGRVTAIEDDYITSADTLVLNCTL